MLKWSHIPPNFGGSLTKIRWEIARAQAEFPEGFKMDLRSIVDESELKIQC